MTLAEPACTRLWPVTVDQILSPWAVYDRHQIREIGLAMAWQYRTVAEPPQHAGAVRESLYVADVFCVIQARSLEFYEGLLAELGRGCESHAKLRASYTGTLAGDFIRWCRGLFPGLVARDLAEFMAASGMMLANQFRVEIEETVRRAARNRRIGGETPP